MVRLPVSYNYSTAFGKEGCSGATATDLRIATTALGWKKAGKGLCQRGNGGGGGLTFCHAVIASHVILALFGGILWSQHVVLLEQAAGAGLTAMEGENTYRRLFQKVHLES